MLRLSKKSDYALMSMKHLAARSDGGASSSAREISEAYDIPLELLAKVLQRLVRARLLVSVQGTRGGYRLARHAAMISVADVIQDFSGVASGSFVAPDHEYPSYLELRLTATDSGTSSSTPSSSTWPRCATPKASRSDRQ